MIDHGDMTLLLKTLAIQTAPTAFNAFYIRFISLHDALTYALVYRGSNLAA